MDGILLVAHVLAATLAFGFVISFDVFLFAVARMGDVGTIRSVYERARLIGPLAGPAFGLAILLGVALSLERHESLLSAWLLLAYGLMAASAALGIVVGRRQALVILELAREAGSAMTPDLARATSATVPLRALATTALMASLIYVMFFKPFS